MKISRLTTILTATAILTAFTVSGQQPSATPAEQPAEETEETDESDDENVDEDDREVREAPEIDYDDDEIDIPVPSFINTSANHLTLNGADWSKVISAVQGHKIAPLSIVHIGDSHLQADIGTGTARELFQFDYGNAGRGIVSPLKMSGTNQPGDYTFSSTRPWSAVKLMKSPWRRIMGFTGTSITPGDLNTNITIGTRSDDDYNPYSSITLFHNGKLNIESLKDASGNNINFIATPSRDFTHIKLDRPVTRVTATLSHVGDLTLYGANLSGDRPGMFYHVIGNNGATYNTYNRIGSVGEGIRPLSPDLVIISLGTNEAFGRIDTSAFRDNIDRLVKNIKASNPQAEILLVTPMECQKSVYTTVKKKVKTKARKGRKGRKGRRGGTRTVTSKVRSYAVNHNIKPLRDAIIKYGHDNNIAVYDWWSVASGDGASTRWINGGLFSRDRVHHSAKGYHLQGRLLYEALRDTFENAK